MTGQYLLSQAGVTALLSAGWKGHSEVVRLLLQAGARDIPDKVSKKRFLLRLLYCVMQDGDTALSMARANNHNEVVQLIQQHK